LHFARYALGVSLFLTSLIAVAAFLLGLRSGIAIGYRAERRRRLRPIATNVTTPDGRR
jgi:hypothetical protein